MSLLSKTFFYSDFNFSLFPSGIKIYKAVTTWHEHRSFRQKKEKKIEIAQMEETLKIWNQNDKISRRESVKVESIRSNEFVFTRNNLLKMSSKQGSSSSMFGSSNKSSSSSSSSSSSWNKNNNNNGSGNGKGVSEKMWKDLTEKMAKLDIEIDYRKK